MDDTKSADASVIANLGAAIGQPNSMIPVPEGAAPLGAYTAIPDDFTITNLEDFQATPNRVRTMKTFRTIPDLAAYLDRFVMERSMGFADWSNGLIHVVIDYHDMQAGGPVPSHCDHVARFKAARSSSWAKWRDFAQQLRSQAEFARFLEERAHEIEAPDPAKIHDLVMRFDIIRKVEFTQSYKVSSGEREFVYRQEDEAKGNVRIPEGFLIRVPIYDGTEPVSVEARLRYRMVDGVLKLGIDFDNVDDVEHTAFDLCADSLRAKHKAMPVLNAFL